jgi:hypothetical protein
MSTDKYNLYPGSKMETPRGGADVVPTDGVELAVIPRAITLNESGIIKLTLDDGSVVEPYLMVGVQIMCRPRIIWKTGTNALITKVTCWY